MFSFLTSYICIHFSCFIFDRINFQKLYFDSINCVKIEPVLKLTSWILKASYDTDIILASYNSLRSYSSAHGGNRSTAITSFTIQAQENY